MMPWVLRPAAVDMLEAIQLGHELEAQGLDHDLDQAQLLALARARLGPAKRWADREPTLSPEVSEALDRIVADRSRPPTQAQDHTRHQAQDQCHDGAGAHITGSPEVPGTEDPSGLDRGQADSYSRAVPGSPVPFDGKDPIKWYLENHPDPPDEDWS